MKHCNLCGGDSTMIGTWKSLPKVQITPLLSWWHDHTIYIAWRRMEGIKGGSRLEKTWIQWTIWFHPTQNFADVSDLVSLHPFPGSPRGPVVFIIKQFTSIQLLVIFQMTSIIFYPVFPPLEPLLALKQMPLVQCPNTTCVSNTTRLTASLSYSSRHL